MFSLDSCDFADDFSDSSSGWPYFQLPTSSYSYQNGQYKWEWTGGSGSGAVFSNAGTTCDDPTIAVDATISTTTHPDTDDVITGILFRFADNDNYYAFSVSSKGSYQVYKLVDSIYTELVPWTSSGAIATGLATNRLFARAIGSQIIVGVNGQVLTTTTDVSLPSGAAGLTAHKPSTSDHTIVLFDNFAQESTVLVPELVINHRDGSPGSFFALAGMHFPANSTAQVTVNGSILATDLLVDSSGGFDFILDTSLADEGKYYVRVSVNPEATTSFSLDAALPLRAKEGGGALYNVPSGIAFTQFVYLPLVVR